MNPEPASSISLIQALTLGTALVAAIAAIFAAIVSYWSSKTERYIDRQWWEKQRETYSACLGVLLVIKNALVYFDLTKELKIASPEEDLLASVLQDEEGLRKIHAIRTSGALELSHAALEILENFENELLELNVANVERMVDLSKTAIDSFTRQAEKDLRIPSRKR